MSLRISPTPLIAGAVVVGNTGLGVLGSAVPSSGDAGASYLYNDLTLPADNNVEVRGLIVTPPSAGAFFAFEDGAFTLTGAADGSYSFVYRLFADGVDLGTATASIAVGVSGSATVTVAAAGLVTGTVAATATVAGAPASVSVAVAAVGLVTGVVAGTATVAGISVFVPSAERTVLVLRLPRIPLQSLPMAPGAALDISWDWTDWLDWGDTIISHSIAWPTSLTPGAVHRTGTVITAWVTMPATTAKNEVCLPICQVTTAAGRTDSRVFSIIAGQR